MMRAIVSAIALLGLAGCATARATRSDGHTFSCIGNDAGDRRPFGPAIPAGSTLVARGMVSAVGEQYDLGGHGYTCVANDAGDRGPFQPRPSAGDMLVVR